MDWFNRAVQDLENEYEEGGLDLSEFNRAMKDLNEECEQSRQDAAQEAYDNHY